MKSPKGYQHCVVVKIKRSASAYDCDMSMEEFLAEGQRLSDINTWLEGHKFAIDHFDPDMTRIIYWFDDPKVAMLFKLMFG